MSLSTNEEPRRGDVHMHGFWHNKLLGVLKTCLFNNIKNYFQYTKHITGKMILLAFRMYVQLYVQKSTVCTEIDQIFTGSCIRAE
eukprot:12268168-Ditylum_brightwellii.AAC.1